MAADENRILAEWDWITLNFGERLHAPERWLDNRWPVTACGRTGSMRIPGALSRVVMPRCRNCCAARGYPPGTGSPKNDGECRTLVQARLEAMKRDG